MTNATISMERERQDIAKAASKITDLWWVNPQENGHLKTQTVIDIIQTQLWGFSDSRTVRQVPAEIPTPTVEEVNGYMLTCLKQIREMGYNSHAARCTDTVLAVLRVAEEAIRVAEMVTGK